jgi:multiple sugar transport system substrate-binding protein
VNRNRIVRALLVGGPMYDPLYARIPGFERTTGLHVEVVDRLPHPELNARVRHDFEAGDPDLDLISTHTKYAPSQAAWLSPLDDLPVAADAHDFLPKLVELARIDGALLQIPRNLDVRLLYYRRDLLAEATNAERPAVPRTWEALVETATLVARPGLAGFLFPGRDSGLFGTFYELLVSAGGQLFDADLRPAFDGPAGLWAVDQLVELHHRRRVTPRDLPTWHYDEISTAFRRGESAMVCDWPGSHHLYISPATSAVADRTGIALLPTGPSGHRAVYAGCHSFAIPGRARNREGAARLVHDLTSTAAQLDEARCGAIPARLSALALIQAEASADPREAHRWDLLARTQEAMIIPPRFPAYPACEDALWRAIQRAIQGLITPQQAVAEGARQIAALFDRTPPSSIPSSVPNAV